MAISVPLDNRILYYGRDREAFRFLSHFWASPIELDGETWATVEHYYQAQKSFDERYRDEIRASITAGRVKKLAAPPDAARRFSRESWFRRNHEVPRSDWHEAKLEIMRRADLAKYTQHPALAAMLLDTRDAELIEDSPYEPFWGIGPDGLGLNWAGRVLMEVRAALAASR